jgi:O-succinylbenzoic acid--CoA ligase
MSALSLAGRDYPFAALAELPAEVVEGDAYEHHVLRFCRRWLSGQAAFVLKTSGSTGEPKPVTLEREQMAASARLTARALGLQAGDRALVCLSADYIAGVMMLVRGLEIGMALTVVQPSSNPLTGFADDAAFDFAAFVPMQFQEILTATPEKRAILNRMKTILVGGAPLSEALAAQVRTLEAPVFHSYGMTETVSHVALRRLNGPSASEDFTPLEGVELGVDADGCLTIKSVLTRNQVLRTRDLVELKADGSFRWLGRLDNVINSGGVKIQAEQVEAALARVFRGFMEGRLAHRRFFVGPLPDPRFGEAVVAMIEGEPLSAEMQADIRRELMKTQLLRRYEIPRFFCFSPRLWETPTGKVDRRANLQALRGRGRDNRW